ncbi:MAG TPA: nuclear transport factor 2 family protein [Lysobacter sp.]
MNIRILHPLARRLAPAFMALAVAFAAPVAAQAQGKGDHLATVRAAFDAWAAGTGGPYALLAEDAVWTITGNSLASKTYANREAFMSEVIRPFNARMSTGLKPTIRNLYRDGDTVIVLFDASGTARDGKPYANTYAWFLELRGDRIVRAVAFFDAIAFDDLWTRVNPTP